MRLKINVITVTLFCLLMVFRGYCQRTQAEPPAQKDKVIALKQNDASEDFVLSIRLDREDGVYKAGDKIKLTVGADAGSIHEDGLDIQVSQWQNGFYMKNLPEGRLSRDKPQTQYSVDTQSPGWLLFSAKRKDSKEKESRIGAVVSPLEIKPGTPPPNDFQDFWANQVAKMRKLRGDVTMNKVDSEAPGVEAFDLTIAMGEDDPPVSGYLAFPVSAKDKTFPAFLYVHGAGVRSSSLYTAVQSALKGNLTLDINAHGLPNGRPKSFYDDLGKGELKDYKYFGKENRETWYFRKMYLRVQAALDYLTSRSEWDGKNLMIYGSSQGGGQALAGAGLDPRVTAIALSVPALCDLTGCHVNRRAGWPQPVPIGKDYGCADERIKGAVRYFDGANFAIFTNADAIFSVGLIDATCPPTSVFSAYNQIKGDKKIIIKPQMGHEIPEDIRVELEKFLESRIMKTLRHP